MRKTIYKIGKQVKINQGFDTFTYGQVLSYDNKKKNIMGFKGNYSIKITGGVDCFGRPAKIGDTITALWSNVTPI